MTTAPCARPPESPQEGDARLRALLEALRRARIGEIRAIEEYLGVAPARPERERAAGGRAWHDEASAGNLK